MDTSILASLKGSRRRHKRLEESLSLELELQVWRRHNSSSPLEWMLWCWKHVIGLEVVSQHFVKALTLLTWAQWLSPALEAILSLFCPSKSIWNFPRYLKNAPCMNPMATLFP